MRETLEIGGRKYRVGYPEKLDLDQDPVAWAPFEKLKQEMAEVKQENEFLEAVSVYFAAERKK